MVWGWDGEIWQNKAEASSAPWPLGVAFSFMQYEGGEGINPLYRLPFTRLLLGSTIQDGFCKKCHFSCREHNAVYTHPV